MRLKYFSFLTHAPRKSSKGDRILCETAEVLEATEVSGNHANRPRRAVAERTRTRSSKEIKSHGFERQTWDKSTYNLLTWGGKKTQNSRNA